MLTRPFAPFVLEIEDELARHSGHAGHRPGQATHFRAKIVSEAFVKLTKLERHRAVYAVLAAEMAEGEFMRWRWNWQRRKRLLEIAALAKTGYRVVLLGKENTVAVTLDEVRKIFTQPLLDLVFEAARVHRAHHEAHEIQLCTLLSIKTGGCTEDCKYCSQSIYNESGLVKETLLDVEPVLADARRARDNGSTRFCMGAAWPKVIDGRAFDRVLEMVRGVRALGLEACVTLEN